MCVIHTLLGLIVACALLWLLVCENAVRSSAAPTSDSASGSPSMEIQIIPRAVVFSGVLVASSVLHVSKDTEPFAVTRIVFNNRAGDIDSVKLNQCYET